MKKVAVSFLGLYSLTSYYFLKNPEKLHKRNRFTHETLNELTDNSGQKILSIAHRGGSYEKVENTIEAFRNAINSGVELLEMDLQLTKDGVIVVCHDENLRRLCDQDVNISNLNYNELPEFAERITLDHFANTILDTTKLGAAKIPTLEEVFKEFPNVFMELDLKGGSEELTRRTNELIKKYEREKFVIWGAMGDDQYLRKYNSELARFFSPFAVFKTYLLYVTGLLPFMPLTNQVFSVAKYTKNYENWKRSKNMPAVGISFALFKLMENTSGPLIKHLQERGILVFHWVLNEEEDFYESMKFNINGIMTDKPGDLDKFLKKHNKKLSGSI